MNKTIKVNPELLKQSSKKEKTKKHHGSNIKPNSLKKQLLQKIKAHRKSREKDFKGGNKEEKKENNDVKSVEDNVNEFDKSMDYLSSIIKDKKNKTLKKKPPSNMPANIPVNIGLPPTLKNDIPIAQEIHIEIPAATSEQPSAPIIVNNSNEPSYGCLKNGRKPTFKTWKNQKGNTEQKVMPKLSFNDDNNEPEKEEKIDTSYRQKRLEQIKEKIKINEETLKSKGSQVQPKKVKSTKHKSTKTYKNKFILGKKDGCISVLIKNKHTRKLNETEKEKLEQKKIPEMKDELRSSGLIKTGSSAPPDVIRELYTASNLAGHIKNENDQTLLDSFLSVN